MRIDEVGLLRRDRDVGLGDEIEREAGDGPVHRRDDRLEDALPARGRQIDDALDERQLAPAIDAREAAAGEALDVGARGERLAGPRDDRDPDVGVVLHQPPALAQLVLQHLVHRVQAIGTIERDGGDVVADLVRDGLELRHGDHSCTRRSASRRSAGFSTFPVPVRGTSASPITNTWRGTL